MIMIFFDTVLTQSRLACIVGPFSQFVTFYLFLHFAFVQLPKAFFHRSQVYLTISQLSFGYLLPIILQTLWVLLLISRLSLHYSASVLAKYGESFSKTRPWSTNMLSDVYDIEWSLLPN